MYGNPLEYTVERALKSNMPFRECPKSEKLRAFLSKYNANIAVVDDIIRKNGRPAAKNAIIDKVKAICNANNDAINEFILIHPDYEGIIESYKENEPKEIAKPKEQAKSDGYNKAFSQFLNACGCMFNAEGEIIGNRPPINTSFLGLNNQYAPNQYSMPYQSYNAIGSTVNPNDPNAPKYFGQSATTLMIVSGVVLLSLLIVVPFAMSVMNNNPKPIKS